MAEIATAAKGLFGVPFNFLTKVRSSIGQSTVSILKFIAVGILGKSKDRGNESLLKINMTKLLPPNL